MFSYPARDISVIPVNCLANYILFIIIVGFIYYKHIKLEDATSQITFIGNPPPPNPPPPPQISIKILNRICDIHKNGPELDQEYHVCLNHMNQFNLWHHLICVFIKLMSSMNTHKHNSFMNFVNNNKIHFIYTKSYKLVKINRKLCLSLLYKYTLATKAQ